jgi:hypothetical protein
MTLSALRYLPRLAPLLVVLTAGLAAGAVYGGFHYAIDALAGLPSRCEVVPASSDHVRRYLQDHIRG